jgi:hypothetical protein
VASVLVALAVAIPSYAQGKSGGVKPGKGPTRPPSSGPVSVQPTGITASGSGTGTSGINTAVATTTPFAWLDDASVVEPGNVWIGVSMARWQGSGLSQTSIPVIDSAFGLTPRVQVGASAPRVAGTLGTMFFSAKVGVLSDDVQTMKVAVGPTLEVLNDEMLPPGQRRVEWGLPVSAHMDRWASRIYGSTGYFSPGIWYVGTGIGRPVTDRIGVSASFSHAWATSPAPSGLAGAAGTPRNDLSGGASYDLNPHVTVFVSIGRTLGLTAEEGAGTTLGVGLSWTSSTSGFTK